MSDPTDDEIVQRLQYVWYTDYDRQYGEYDKKPAWATDMTVYYGDVDVDGFGDEAITIYETDRQDTAWIVADKECDLMDYI